MGNSSSVEEPTQEEDAANERRSFNLLLCGPTGTGKSSTGNHILQKESIFKVEENDVATRSTLQWEEGHLRDENFDIKVVDMPGLEYVKRDVQTAVGYDAVLLTIRYGRVPNYIETQIKKLKKIYGKNVLQQRGILVITHGDKFKQNRDRNEKIFDYCSKQTGLLNYLWEECNKRVVLFDNVTEDPKELEFQRERLFDILLHNMKTEIQPLQDPWCQRVRQWFFTIMQYRQSPFGRPQHEIAPEIAHMDNCP